MKKVVITDLGLANNTHAPSWYNGSGTFWNNSNKVCRHRAEKPKDLH